MAERIVVVGHGATTCLGRDMDATWENLSAGKSGLKRHEGLFPSETFAQSIAGAVEDFGPGTVGENQEVAKLEARSIHLAMSSAREAWRDAKIQECDYDPQRVAIVVGSAMGGLDLYDAENARAAKRKSLATSPYLIPGMIINQSAGQIAQHLHLRGPSIAPANACVGGSFDRPRRRVVEKRRGRSRRLRRFGERVHAGGRQRLRHDEGPLRSQKRRPFVRRPRASQPAV